MSRKVTKRIKTTGGDYTYKLDDPYSEFGHWYRNGFPIYDTSQYKIYDKSLQRNRVLSEILDENYNVYPEAIVDAPNYEKLVIEETNEQDKLGKLAFNRYPAGDRSITLRTEGNMNLATIPINMLDSIAINSGRSNTPIKTNLGLIGKESTFGGYSIPLKNPLLTNDYDVYSLVNNHAFMLGPHADFLGAIDRKYPKVKNKYSDKARIDQENLAKYYLKHPTQSKTPHYSDNYLQDAFLRYNTNPSSYNPGQSNYIQMVNNIANEVWNEPQIQNWWKTEGINYYNKGKEEKESKKESAESKDEEPLDLKFNFKTNFYNSNQRNDWNK